MDPEQYQRMLVMKHMKDSSGVKCDACGNQTFKETYLIRKISKLLTGAPMDITVPYPLFTCEKCGNVNDDFRPKEFTIDETTDKISDEG